MDLRPVLNADNGAHNEARACSSPRDLFKDKYIKMTAAWGKQQIVVINTEYKCKGVVLGEL